MDLTKKKIVEEYIKCRNDILEYCKYVKIEHPTLGIIQFDPFQYQKDLLVDFQNHRFNIINKSRQMGITTLLSIYVSWYMLFFKNKTVMLMSYDSEVPKEFIDKVKVVYTNLPEWLQPKMLTNNVKSIRLSNRSRVKATSSTKNVGRTLAASLAIIDECIEGNTKIKIRNKKTHEIYEIPIEDLYKMTKYE
jgi:hypothetical protein